MATITFKGNPIRTNGSLPAVGKKAPAFKLTASDLTDISLSKYAGRRKVLNIFPSLDTPVCAKSVRQFNERAASIKNAVVLNISADLPFAQSRFCGSEGIKNSETLSCFRSEFAKALGLKISEGTLAGLTARAVIILDENDVVSYVELVPEIAQEPNYDAALKALQ